MSTQFASYPDNPNFLSPVGFRFTISKIPNVSFFTQRVSVPAISLGSADIQTPFSKISMPGDHITYSEFRLMFRVDEDLTNYTSIFNWITGLGFPESFDQYLSVASPKLPTINTGMFSDGVLEILGSAKQTVMEVQFKDMHPTSLSELEFDSTEASINYISATATFAYRTFSLNKPR